MNETIVYLDVDGVIAPYARDGAQEWSLWGTTRGPGVVVPWSATLAARLLRWQDLGATVVWATSWEHHARAYLDPLIGWRTPPEILRFDFAAAQRTGVWAKQLVVCAHAPNMADVIWIDDDLRRVCRHPSIRTWIKARTGTTTLIVPIRERGLSANQVARIDRLITRQHPRDS